MPRGDYYKVSNVKSLDGKEVKYSNYPSTLKVKVKDDRVTISGLLDPSKGRPAEGPGFTRITGTFINGSGYFEEDQILKDNRINFIAVGDIGESRLSRATKLHESLMSLDLIDKAKGKKPTRILKESVNSKLVNMFNIEVAEWLGAYCEGNEQQLVTLINQAGFNKLKSDPSFDKYDSGVDQSKLPSELKGEEVATVTSRNNQRVYLKVITGDRYVAISTVEPSQSTGWFVFKKA